MQEASSHRYPSPFRYPGGKGKVANFVKLLFLRNNLAGHSYVEPYAGGASVALSILYEEYASHIYINDLNRSIFAFWHSVINRTDDLCRLIIDTAVTMEEWTRQKAVQKASDPDLLELAFSTFFLNRTNRSGIIAGGAIGGREQGGPWKLDARYNKTELVRRIEKVARYRSRITLSQVDAAEYIRSIISQPLQDSFVYLDPPYYVKGEGLYEHFYRHENHMEIANLVSDLRNPWVVSYDAAPEILDLYAEYKHIAYDLSYSAADRYRGNEVMFFSSSVEPPDVQSPANIRVDSVDRERKAVSSLF